MCLCQPWEPAKIEKPAPRAFPALLRSRFLFLGSPFCGIVPASSPFEKVLWGKFFGKALLRVLFCQVFSSFLERVFRFSNFFKSLRPCYKNRLSKKFENRSKAPPFPLSSPFFFALFQNQFGPFPAFRQSAHSRQMSAVCAPRNSTSALGLSRSWQPLHPALTAASSKERKDESKMVG